VQQVVIENPILNSPFEVPRRHYKFDEDGITDQIADNRRPRIWVSRFSPVHRSRTQPPRPARAGG
jgi:type III restriction enzyme